MKSFASLILLAGSAAALPASDISLRAEKPDCMSAASKVKHWTVHDFDFHASYIFSTPSHQISNGYVNFTLENAALDYKPVCSSSSSQLSDFYYGTQVYHCSVPGKAESGDAATYTFSRPSGELKINQTWTCPDEGGVFNARGGTKLKLDCKESKWQNPNWKLGQIYSSRTVTCKHVTVKAPIDYITGIL